MVYTQGSTQLPPMESSTPPPMSTQSSCGDMEIPSFNLLAYPGIPSFDLGFEFGGVDPEKVIPKFYEPEPDPEDNTRLNLDGIPTNDESEDEELLYNSRFGFDDDEYNEDEEMEQVSEDEDENDEIEIDEESDEGGENETNVYGSELVVDEEEKEYGQFENETRELQEVDIGREFQAESVVKVNGFEAGMLFENTRHLRQCIIAYAIYNKVLLDWKKNKSFKLIIGCKGKTREVKGKESVPCKWKLYGRVIGCRKTPINRVMKVRSCHNVHTCQKLTDGINPCAKVRFCADAMEARCRENPNHFRPYDLALGMMRIHKVKINYYKAWRAVNILKERIWGNFEESFSYIPELCAKIHETNPGSVAEYGVDSSGQFK